MRHRDEYETIIEPPGRLFDTQSMREFLELQGLQGTVELRLFLEGYDRERAWKGVLQRRIQRVLDALGLRAGVQSYHLQGPLQLTLEDFALRDELVVALRAESWPAGLTVRLSRIMEQTYLAGRAVELRLSWPAHPGWGELAVLAGWSASPIIVEAEISRLLAQWSTDDLAAPIAPDDIPAAHRALLVPWFIDAFPRQRAVPAGQLLRLAFRQAPHDEAARGIAEEVRRILGQRAEEASRAQAAAERRARLEAARARAASLLLDARGRAELEKRPPVRWARVAIMGHIHHTCLYSELPSGLHRCELPDGRIIEYGAGLLFSRELVADDAGAELLLQVQGR